MSRKQKLLQNLRKNPPPTDFSWDDVVTLMKLCGFEELRNTGSRRKFVHRNGVKVILHEPHPERVIKRYMIREILDGLRAAGEIV